MKILIADDDATSRLVLEALVRAIGHTPVVATDGWDAIQILRAKDAPLMALLDWEMPKMGGDEICRRVREGGRLLYLILVTSRAGTGNLVEGLGAGADDYIVKPVEGEELLARVKVGIRMIQLQATLAERVKQLEEAGVPMREIYLPI